MNRNPAVFWIGIILTLCAVLLIPGCRRSRGSYENVRGRHLFLENGEKKLLWFSGIHTNDTTSIVFEDIRSEIERFVPALVLVEGGFGKAVYSSDTEAKLDGESAYTSHICRRLEIPCGDIEPDDAETHAHLLEQYTPETILAFLILRQMHQIQRESKMKPIDFSLYFEHFIAARFAEGLPEIAMDENTVSSLLEPHVGHAVNNANWFEVDAYGLIYGKQAKLYPVWKNTYDFRNTHVLDLLKRLFPSYDRIFIVMGFDHARDLSKDLKRLMKNVRPLSDPAG